MRDICAQGAAQGVWKERMRVVVGGREERWVWKSGAEVMSVVVDMMVSSSSFLSVCGGCGVCVCFLFSVGSCYRGSF